MYWSNALFGGRFRRYILSTGAIDFLDFCVSLTIERKEVVDGHENDLALSVVHDRTRR